MKENENKFCFTENIIQVHKYDFWGIIFMTNHASLCKFITTTAKYLQKLQLIKHKVYTDAMNQNEYKSTLIHIQN